MARLYLVRHAEAAAEWGVDDDPGLSEPGRAQAAALADRLGPQGPLPIMTSPLRRARETAAALEGRWHTLALVEPGLGEIPTPPDVDDRRAWLRETVSSTWSALGPRYTSWRTMVAGLLVGIPHDTVVVTHFMLINVALGQAQGRDDVWVANVANGSVTVVDNGGAGDHDLTVIESPDHVDEPGRVL